MSVVSSDRRRRVSRHAWSLALALAIGGCSPGPAPGPAPAASPVPSENGPASARPHIFFLLLDTLRADHLGLYGYERETSPVLDRFAEASVVFERAQSQAPCTFPSANSMLTGRYPGHFLLQAEGRIGIPAHITSLPALLRDAGYDTLAISGSPIVRREPSAHNPAGGFDAGFDTFDETCLWNRADCINTRLFRAIESRAADGGGEGAHASDRPLFAYLHYMDAHDPYVLPDNHELLFVSPYEGDHPQVRAGRPGLVRKQRLEGESLVLSESDVKHLVDLYDERVRYLDGKLEELFEELDARGLLKESIVVIASDHGEQFDEHGSVAHCNALYEEELATPLILRLPASYGASGRRAALVENVDIVPTVLDYAGVGSADLDLDGRSLRNVIDGRPEEVSRLAFAVWGVSLSVRDDRYKLIADLRSERVERFDLVLNPAEDVSIESTGSADGRLSRELASWLELRSGVPEGRAVIAGQTAVERLKALGYLH